jgi:hypothetical protein
LPLRLCLPAKADLWARARLGPATGKGTVLVRVKKKGGLFRRLGIFVFVGRKPKVFETITFLFLFDNYYSIMEYLKDLSRDLQVNCVIKFYFFIYLMLHACALKFNVTKNFENILVLE